MKKLSVFFLLISTEIFSQDITDIDVSDSRVESIEITFRPNLMTRMHSDIPLLVPSLTIIRGNEWPKGKVKLSEPFNVQPFTGMSLDVFVRAGNNTKLISARDLINRKLVLTVKDKEVKLQ